MSIMKNPQIRFEGCSPKEYHFPKYPGKFLMQAEKLRDFKSLKNYMPHKVRKQAKYHNDLYKEEYKEMKAETDYIKRIQELKKKLQKQIKRYNQEKKNNQELVKSLSMSIDHKSSVIKLNEICVNMRYNRLREEASTPQNKQSKSLERRRYLKSFRPKNYQSKNKTEMKNRSNKEESEPIRFNNFSYLSEAQQYYTNKTERLGSSQAIKLPKITRKQYSVDPSSYLRNKSQNRLQLLSEIDKLTLSANMTPKNLTKKQTELINRIHTQTAQAEHRRFMFNLSDKYSAKRLKKRLAQSDQKPKDNQPHLKGWDIGPQTKEFIDSDQII